jgi:hypothetical protein
VGKPGGKKPLGRPGNRWENNIKMDLRQTGWGCMDWTDLAKDRVKWRGSSEQPILNLQVS